MENILKNSGKVILFACLSIVLLTGCDQKSKLKLGIEAANKQCPMKMGTVGEVSSITYDGTDVVYHYTVDEKSMDIATMKDSEAEIKQNIKSSLDVSEPALKMFLEACIKNNKGLGYQYTGTPSGESVEILFSAAEIKALL